MEELLNDTSKFHDITFNSKHMVNKEVIHFLDIEPPLKHVWMISVTINTYQQRIIRSRPGVMYGICKVHKEVDSEEGTPLFRPILSAIGTCVYGVCVWRVYGLWVCMAKFFVPILKTSTVNQFTIDGSLSSTDEILTLYMTSFDIKSLFTNIPLDETIDICIEKLY